MGAAPPLGASRGTTVDQISARPFMTSRLAVFRTCEAHFVVRHTSAENYGLQAWVANARSKGGIVHCL